MTLTQPKTGVVSRHRRFGLLAAAVEVAVAGGEHPPTKGALAGAAVDAALLGAAFGAISGGVAAHVSLRHWMPVWARGAAVGIGPTKGRGAALVARLAF